LTMRYDFFKVLFYALEKKKKFFMNPVSSICLNRKG
jgi:hypothetical protein